MLIMAKKKTGSNKNITRKRISCSDVISTGIKNVKDGTPGKVIGQSKTSKGYGRVKVDFKGHGIKEIPVTQVKCA